MEAKNAVKLFGEFINKYKYFILVLLIGFLLVIIPVNRKSDSVSVVQDTNNTSVSDFEIRLAEILSKVDGAGSVVLMLTIAEGEEIKYQEDEKLDEGDTIRNVNKDTIVITDSERNQKGLVKQVIPAVYQGAVVVCQGADSPVVRLAIIDAVTKLTGLSSNKISVLKMI